MTQDDAETEKLSSGTAALWENVVNALLGSDIAVLEEAGWSASASVTTRWLEEGGAEVISASLVHNVISVTGMDMHLNEKQKPY